ncbi:peptidase family M13 [Teladorsagia circumcincta]|uniref:Peptidase family M13 n=1 Tax=Teladorsagia circumcincta TaxID=45464 RepID=A0A2G9UHU4_TELCI|nr:peptidase family M13 [Teladorsagia circumcincta]
MKLLFKRWKLKNTVAIGSVILIGNSTGKRCPTIPKNCSVGSSQNQSLCLSKKCVRLAANYLNNMKPKVNPCKDFYSFACGSFATNRVVPEHEKKINVLFEMEREHKLHLKDILEDASADEESKAMTLSRTYYNSCMDEEAQAELGTLPMLSLISHMGGWELLTNARFDAADYHWEATAGRLQIYGVDGLIRVFVQRGFEDSDAQLIMLGPPKLFLEKKKFYRGAPSTNAYLSYYRQYITNVLKMLGADMDDDSAGIEYQVNDIIDLERRIANVGLSALVKSKPLNCINNYMMFRLVSSFDVYLSQQYRRPLQQFHSNMYGKTAEAIEMIGDFKNSMKTLLLDAEWMDDATRAAALKKLESMRYKIGFPDYIFNETEVLRPFKGVLLVADRYFDNALELRKASIRDNLNELRRKPGSDEWAFPVIAVDAFYSFTGNEIVFPAGILQYPIFIPEAPFYLNYASIGIAVGHEITHGYDDLGAQYDANGSLRGWWDEGTLETFRQRRQCFINQYGKQVDGRSSIGENIADNGGMRLAYEAYKMRRSRESNLTKVLPGLAEWTAEQLFFIAYANVWCEVVKTSSVNYLMDTDVHPLGMFRVNVPLQNFPPFSEAFNCPIGSPMNPYEKCRVW